MNTTKPTQHNTTYITLHNSFLRYTTLNYTTQHYTTLKYTTLPVTQNNFNLLKRSSAFTFFDIPLKAALKLFLLGFSIGSMKVIYT